MRGTFEDQGRLFSYISPEQRVPTRRPLRTIRELVREVLSELDRDFRKLYPATGSTFTARYARMPHMQARPIPTAISTARARARRVHSATWGMPRWKPGTA